MNQTSPALESPQTSPPAHKLLPTMGLFSLTMYGIGDMLGSGIYALVGKAAGIMGNAIWLAFLASMVAALLTALSYACLGSRYPRAAGAAYITSRAFRRPFLSYIVGLAMMASGLTSMATSTRAFAGYVQDLFGAVPTPLLVIGFILVLTAVNFWGMRESTWLNLICTTIEVGGLVFIVLIGMRYWGGVDYLETPPSDPGGADHSLSLTLVLNGAVLTFFSFVGFEDMLNVAEEVKDPTWTLPRGIVLAMIGATIIYISVAVTAVSVVPYAELAASKGPLVEVVRRAAPGFKPGIFTFISIFAITNTVLLNYIMGSRLAYGMAHQGLLPRVLGRIHPKRRTPHVAIFSLMAVALTLALSVDLTALAKSTSVLLLGVFVVINIALVVVKFRPDEPRGRFEVPVLVPLAAAVVCFALLLHAKREELIVAGYLLAGIVALYFVTRATTGVTPDLATADPAVTHETLCDSPAAD